MTALADRPLDLICLGRVAVDLYGRQLGGRLEDMQSFNMYLGGSSGNVAFGAARLGLRSSMLSRVGDEHLGRFVREELRRAGCDTSHLHTDEERLTALVVLGVRGDGTFPHIFYRERPADMAISPDDFDETFIALSRALAITGTHLSHDAPRAACYEALKAAKAHHTRAILDIDYRPVLWGLVGHGKGDDRFVPSAEVTKRLQQVLPWFDIVVGTEEEMHIAGGSTDTLVALNMVREQTEALLVLKRGSDGCVIFEGKIPERIDDGLACPALPVPVYNTLGAGDGFLAGFLRGLLGGEDVATAGRWGNACGALVVSRDACAPAMPSFEELTCFLEKHDGLCGASPDSDRQIRRLHRVAERRERWGDVAILAFDHRAQLEEAVRDPARIARLKELIARGAQHGARGAGLANPHVIVDDRYGWPVLTRLCGSGAFIARPIELPGARPLAFEGGLDVGTTLSRWPREHVVKCLLRYSMSDDPGLRRVQDELVLTLCKACCTTGHELMLELLGPRDDGSVKWDVPLVMRHLYQLGVCPDWWKLAPPPDDLGWAEVEDAVREHDPHCRGVLLLGLDMELDKLERLIAHAARTSRVCRGFAVGRSIWRVPLEMWLKDDDDEAFVRDVAAAYARLVDVWRQARLASGLEGGAA